VDQEHKIWKDKIDGGCESEPFVKKFTNFSFEGTFWKSDDTILNLCSCIVNINRNIHSKLMIYRITSNTNGTFTVRKKEELI
jgi:hypothetical protein